MYFPVYGFVERIRISEKRVTLKKCKRKLTNMSKSIVKIKGLGLVEIVPDRVQIKIHIEELFDNTTDAYKNW